MRTLTALIAALLAPTALWAAEGTAAPATGTEAPPVVFRLSADGAWLGAVRGDPSGEAALFVAPLLPTPRAVSPLTIGGLFSVPTGNGQQVIASVQQQRVPSLALAPSTPAWCQGLVGMMAGSADCALGVVPGAQALPAITRRQGSLAWSGRAVDLAVSATSSSGWSAGGSTWLPGVLREPLLASPEPGLLTPSGFIDGQDITLSGLWRIAPWGGLTLSASLGESAWQVAPGTAPLALDQAALRLGMVRGAFSGGITGRVMRSDRGLAGADYPLWTGVDIGITWRTPWRGELAIGAQNLIGHGNDGLPAPAAPAINEATARTPYVRYTQDL